MFKKFGKKNVFLVQTCKKGNFEIFGSTIHALKRQPIRARESDQKIIK